MATSNAIVAVISLTSARFLPETRGRDLDAPIADEPPRRVLEPASA